MKEREKDRVREIIMSIILLYRVASLLTARNMAIGCGIHKWSTNYLREIPVYVFTILDMLIKNSVHMY